MQWCTKIKVYRALKRTNTKANDDENEDKTKRTRGLLFVYEYWSISIKCVRFFIIFPCFFLLDSLQSVVRSVGTFLCVCVCVYMYRCIVTWYFGLFVLFDDPHESFVHHGLYLLHLVRDLIGLQQRTAAWQLLSFFFVSHILFLSVPWSSVFWFLVDAFRLSLSSYQT